MHLRILFLAAACAVALGCSRDPREAIVEIFQNKPDPEPAKGTPSTTPSPKPHASDASRIAATKPSSPLEVIPPIECRVDPLSGTREVVIAPREGAPIYDDADGKKIAGTLEFFVTPYFVFEARNGRLLLGTTHAKSSLLGWVDGKDVTPWPTIIGAVPVADGAVFSDRESAVEFAATGTSTRPPLAHFAKPEKRKPWLWPVLSAEVVSKGGRTFEVLEIQFIGKSGAGSSAPKSSAPVAATTIKERTGRLQCAFVLDATGSMKPFFAEAIARIESLANALENARGAAHLAPEFALVVYRDRSPGDEFVTQVRAFDSIAALRRSLAAIQPQGGGDTPECGIDGLYAALDRLAWSDDPLATRMIIGIGDAPFHARGSAGAKSITLDDVVAAAVAKSVPLLMIAMGFDLHQHPSKLSAETRQQVEQFRSLADRAGGSFCGSAQADLAVKKVESILAESARAIDARSRVVDAAAAGAADAATIATRARLPIESVTEVLEFFSDAGVDLSQLSSVDGVTAARGFVATRDSRGAEILRRELLLGRGACELMITTLSALNALMVERAGSAATVGSASALAHTRFNPLLAIFKDPTLDIDIALVARGVPVGTRSALRLAPLDAMSLSEHAREELRRKVDTAFRAISAARNDDARWHKDQLFVPEEAIP